MENEKILTEIVIEKFLNGGQGLGHDEEGKPVFVEGAYPGEIVDVRVESEKKNFMLGKAVNWKYRIPERNQPVCKVFRKCGACEWLDLDYNFQLASKETIITEQFQRLGNIDTTGLLQPILASAGTLSTRNKMVYACMGTPGGIVLGLKEKASNRVIEPKGCKIADEKFEKIRMTMQEIFNELFTTEDIFHERSRRGFLRGIAVRKTEYTGQYMLILITSFNANKQVNMIKGKVKSRLSFVDSMIQVYGKKKTLLAGEYNTVFGKGTLTEKIEWFDYNIPPTSFFQTNTKMLKSLLETIKEIAQPNREEVLLDLYGGVGFFSIYLAPLYKKVILVESQHDSVKAAVANASLNKLTNLSVKGMMVEDYVDESVSIQPNTLIVDPPRAGIDKTVLTKIIEMAPGKIVYVSCDLGTLVRDCVILQEAGYKIDLIQPVDMFPHTAHIENIVRLSR
ncbi:MAG TPA: 23S rRNA (uracil(1939)-C(5))-methyltransferase RlmD [Thermotogota bacterium]|nr:23S rRNA (uracil(1939)-C(5))-methyltransferase RlmD [Thermotogota bacterium]